MQKSNRVANIISWLTGILVFLLAVGSFIISFYALTGEAELSGITGKLSTIWALIIDGSLVVFSLSVINAHLQKGNARKQWLLTITFFILTLTFNILHAPNNLQSKFVAAIAPIGLFFSFHMLVEQVESHLKRFRLNSELSEINEIFNVKNAKLKKLEKQIENAKEKLSQVSSTRKTKRIEKLVRLLEKTPDESVANLSDALNVSRPTIYSDLERLENEGIIQKNGQGYKIV